MLRRARPAAVAMRLALGISALGFLPACLPPPMPLGYVALDPSSAGGVDLAGQVGGGGDFGFPGGFAGSGVHVEPFVRPKLSIPIGVGVAAFVPRGGGAYAVSPLRLGLRHRASRFLAWGGGLGPSVAFNRRGIDVAAVVDLELVLGRQWDRVGFSFGSRPSLSTDFRASQLYVILEPELALRIGQELHLTIGAVGGPYFQPPRRAGGRWGAAGFFGGSLGLHRRF